MSYCSLRTPFLVVAEHGTYFPHRLLCCSRRSISAGLRQAASGLESAPSTVLRRLPPADILLQEDGRCGSSGFVLCR